MILETVVLARRDLKKWWKSKFSVLSTLFRPLVWLLLFGKAFNPAKLVVGDGGQGQLILGGAPDYFSFMAAGMVAVMVLNLSVRSMTSVVLDRYLGFLDKLIASPIRRESILLSKTLASAVRAIVQGIVVLIVAVLLGMRLGPAFGAAQFGLLVLVLLLLAISLSAFFVSVGVVVRRWETQEALATAITLPIMFTSSVFYPVSTMPGWLAPLAAINPVTYSTEALRGLFYGSGGDLSLPSTFGFDLLYLAACTGLSILIMVLASARLGSSR